MSCVPKHLPPELRYRLDYGLCGGVEQFFIVGVDGTLAQLGPTLPASEEMLGHLIHEADVAHARLVGRMFRDRMKGVKKLSPTMLKVLKLMLDHGDRIIRWPGGFWRVKDLPSWSTGATTIQALVDRGLIRYCRYQKRTLCPDSGAFPIEAVIVDRWSAFEAFYAHQKPCPSIPQP